MRSYKQFCGIAKALDLVGERWTLLLVRELLPGGRRYTDLLAASPGLTTNLLAKRLRHLEAHGIVHRRVLPPPAASTVYELTTLGRELEPVLLALGRFGAHFLDTPADDERVDLRWLCISVCRRYADVDPTPFTVQLVLPGVPMQLRWEDGRLRPRDGEHPSDAVLSGAALPAVLLGSQPLEEAELRGEVAAANRLLRGLTPMSPSPP